MRMTNLVSITSAPVTLNRRLFTDLSNAQMSPITDNLESSNSKYASSFTQGDLALPPAKKYLVRTSLDQTKLD